MMEHRDPRELILETARRSRRRARANLLLPCIAPAVALTALLATGHLPIEVAAAALILGTLVVSRAVTFNLQNDSAASTLDRRLGGKDHFLTLATVPSDPAAPLEPVVVAGAAKLGATADPAAFSPPLARRPIAVSIAVAALLFLGLQMTSGPFPRLDPADRLLVIAENLLESGNAGDRKLGAGLMAVVEVLRDPGRSPEEKREAAAAALEKLQEPSSASSAESGGGERGGAQGEEGGASGDARNEAMEQLGKAAGNQAGETSQGSSGERQQAAEQSPSAPGESPGESPGSQPHQAGGGVKGPEKPQGAGERADQTAGNQPGPGQGKSREQRGSGDGETQPGDQSKPESSQAQDEDRRGPGQGTGRGGEGSRPQASDPTRPDERFFEGEGPGGWKVVDGRYVRVRIPEDGDASDVERVAGPGRVETETPFGNAPLPDAGKPGAVRDTQPLPLEYRNVLRGDGEEGER